jgi:hypothetical protein
MRRDNRVRNQQGEYREKERNIISRERAIIEGRVHRIVKKE